MGDATSPGQPGGECRLCGCSLRSTEELARAGGEFFHASCAEPAMRNTTAWHEREIGTLNQLVAGIGRATVV